MSSYNAENVFYLKETARWSYIVKKASSDDIAVIIDQAMADIEDSNPALKGAVSKNLYATLGADKSKLKSLIDEVNKIDAHRFQQEDLIGRVYEYFLQVYAASGTKEDGEFYTPACVVKLIAEMIEPYSGTVYDIILQSLIQFNFSFDILPLAGYEAFAREVVARSIVRVRGFLTIYGGGQLDPKLCEDFNPALYNIDRMERVIDANRDNVLGLKIRLSRGVVPEETGCDYLRAAVELADELNRRLGTALRVCVHTTNPPVRAGELAECLRPGDIYCHCYQGAGNPIVSEEGVVDPLILAARKRGVLFDAANGRGNFGLETAKRALKAGFLPDIISSDLTVDKFNMPPYAKNLPLVLSKYLALGMDLMEIIKAATMVPAEVMGMDGEIGTLRPGAYADIAIFALRDKQYVQKDFCDTELLCRQLLVPQLTMLAGEIQYCQSDFYL